MSKQTELAQVADTITVDSGNVGIGVLSPASAFLEGAALDVGGPVLARGAVAIHHTNASVFQYNSNTTSIRSYGATANSGEITFTTGGGGTADSERMRIDSAGRVTMPYQPAFMAYAGGDRFFSAPQSTWTDLNIFDSINHNIGNHYNSTTDNFTCPVSGVYHFYVNVREETYYGSWGGIHIQLVNNGSRFAETRKWDGYQNEETLTLSITRQFSANDVVGVRVHSDSSDTDLSVEGGSTTFFGGHLLG
jgi:hypothetical protein